MNRPISPVWPRCALVSGWTRALHRVVAALTVLALANGAHADQAACLQAHEQGQLAGLHDRPAEARAEFTRCMAPSCPRILRDDCRSLLAQLDASRVSLSLTAHGEAGETLTAVRVYIDGALVTDMLDGRPIALDPGAYELRLESLGRLSHIQPLALAKGERERVVRVQLGALREPEPAKPARGAKLAAAVLGGSALAALAAGIGLGVAGKRELERLDAACGVERDCGAAQTDKGRAMYIGADVSFALSGALAAAGLTVFLVDYYRKPLDTKPRANLTAAASAHGASVSLRGSF